MPKAKDYTGEKFGRLTAIERVRKYERNRFYTYYKCECECGNIFEVRKDNIKSGHTTSCGCLSSKAGKNLLNQVFNHLTVIGKTKKRNSAGSIIWECKCDCSDNSIIEVDTHSLISGATQSCGCLTSKGEEKIASLLTQYNIPFIKQKTLLRRYNPSCVHYAFTSQLVLKAKFWHAASHSAHLSIRYDFRLVFSKRVRNRMHSFLIF